MDELKKEENKDINKDEHLENIENINNEASDKYGINVEIEKEQINDDIYNIDVEIEKVEVRIDQLEINFEANEDASDEEVQEYNDLKDKLKELNKQKKSLKKKESESEPKTALDHLSPWIIFYGIIMTLICLPGISYQIWFDFAAKLIELFEDTFNAIVEIEWLYYPMLVLIIFAIPLILELLSWFLYVNVVKKKVNKHLFLGIWILQSLLTIGMIIFVCVNIF